MTCSLAAPASLVREAGVSGVIAIDHLSYTAAQFDCAKPTLLHNPLSGYDGRT